MHLCASYIQSSWRHRKMCMLEWPPKRNCELLRGWISKQNTDASANSNCNQTTTNQNPNQTTTNQNPNQTTTNQNPNQTTTNQNPNQTTTNQNPNQTTTNQNPNSSTGNILYGKFDSCICLNQYWWK